MRELHDNIDQHGHDVLMLINGDAKQVRKLSSYDYKGGGGGKTLDNVGVAKILSSSAN